MPVRPLPRELIRRLKKSSHVISAYLGHMENVDHRIHMDDAFIDGPRDTHSAGGWVRQMNISKTFPDKELVIKRAHDPWANDEHAASETIKKINLIVDNHNKEHNSENYELRKPNIYGIGHGLIAMAKTNAPSIDEIFIHKTKRGLAFMRNLIREHKIGVTKFKEICDEVEAKTKIHFQNMLVIGVEEGEVIFMPLPDLF